MLVGNVVIVGHNLFSNACIEGRYRLTIMHHSAVLDFRNIINWYNRLVDPKIK